ncbi:purine-nucleoside phosphorylase [Acidianus sp. HS-5]|uniref:phosphorylase family protein n=1 Tax=Acidianus sp. HS-5 TaxID=2886040 RepID=UPI001F4250E9|nr:purine-nucleoside phosphorylase [Acidianus sp. HS-5]BDC18823.1 purine-nucleoside phosphorylase [Acidianus sp. HS-5]
MVYGNFIRNQGIRRKVIKEELGIEEDETPERVVVMPMPFSTQFPKNFEDTLTNLGIKVNKAEVGDQILREFGGNLLLEKDGNRGLITFIGRGLIDFTERIRILATISRIKDILFIGTAGSLSNEILIGDLNIPKYVVPFENVSDFYVDPTIAIPQADEKLFNEIYEYARETGVKTHSALHATLLFFYSETTDFLNYLMDIGVSTIDMEVSAFYKIARFYGKRAVALLRISDMPLIEQQEQQKPIKARRETAVNATFKIVLRFLKLI